MKRKSHVFFSVLISLVLIVSFNISVLASDSIPALSNINPSSDEYGIDVSNTQIVDALTAGQAGSYEKDLSSGEVSFIPAVSRRTASNEIPQHIPEGVPPMPRSVIGSDTRSAVGTPWGPYYNHCKIIATFPNGRGLGTGWMIGSNKLATAGHVIFDRQMGGWATSVAVYPAANYTSFPLGVVYATNLSIGGEWGSSSNSFDDWGLIKLNSNIGNSTGWLGRKAWSSSQVIGKSCIVAGYPGDINKRNGLVFENYRMYSGGGTIQGSLSRALPKITHNVDTGSGQSGSPIFGYESGLGYTAYAIHTQGTGGDGGPSNNSGILINDWLANAMYYF